MSEIAPAALQETPAVLPFVGINRCLSADSLVMPDLQAFQAEVRALGNIIIQTSCVHLCARTVTAKSVQHVYERSGMPADSWNTTIRAMLAQSHREDGLNTGQSVEATMTGVSMRGSHVVVDLEAEALQAERQFLYRYLGNTNHSGFTNLWVSRIHPYGKNQVKREHLDTLKASFAERLQGRTVTLGPVTAITQDHWRPFRTST